MQPLLLLGYRFKILLIAAIASIYISGSECVAYSQPDSDKLEQLSIEELLQVSVSTASKKNESIKRTPASVFVITQEDIERFGYKTLAEAVSQVIGFFSGTDRTYEEIAARGLTHGENSYNQRILVMIDGHRVNDLLYNYAAVGSDFPLDMRSVDHIEIAKGPGSTLWGTNAMLAVINVFSKSASDNNAKQLCISYGNNGLKTAFAEYSSTINNKLKITASATTMISSGEKSVFFPEFNDPSTNNGIASDLDGENAQKSFIRAASGCFDASYFSTRRKKDYPTASYGMWFNTSPAYSYDSQSFFQLSYTQPQSEERRGNFYACSYLSKYDYHSDGVYYDPPVLNKDYSSSICFGGEARYNYDFGSKASALIGAEFQRGIRARRGNFDVDPLTVYYENDTHPYNYSGFTQLEFNPSDHLKIVAGLRLDHYKTFADHLCPRFGLIYSPDESESVKLLTGRAFRAPTDSEIWGISSNNLNLKPEEMNTTELVWEKQLNQVSSLVTSLYGLRLTSSIADVVVDNWSHFENVGSFHSKGIETQLETRLPNDVKAHFGLSILNTSDPKDYFVASPRVMMLGGISLPVLSSRYYLSPDFVFLGDRKTRSGANTRPVCLVNLTLVAANRQAGLSMSVRIKNLFNSANYVPSTASYTQDRLPLPRRTIELEFAQPL